MECPLCAALNRAHNQECEAEAAATLKLRGGNVSAERLDQEVLRSRKRQAHIAFELHRHRTSEHPTLAMEKAAAG